MRKAIATLDPGAVLLVGYSPGFHRLAFFEAWRSRAPLLFRGETTDHTQRRSVSHAFARSIALRVLYRTCARLLYVGQHSYQHFTRLGVPTAKLQLVPKSERVRNNFNKILLWIDPERGISVQQQFFDPQGDYRLAKYSDVKVNEKKIPDEVFRLKTTSKTQVVSPH